MKGRVLVMFLAILPWSVPAHAVDYGYVYGIDHCYHFASPPGWVMDAEALASEKVPMAFRPDGTEWNRAAVRMYTLPSRREAGDNDPIRTQVEEVLRMYRDVPVGLTAERIGDVRGADGGPGQLWRFSGHAGGASELVAYFIGRETVNFFVMQVGPRIDADRARRDLVLLASSYIEGDACVPCKLRHACAASPDMAEPQA